jgi:transcriptional regulator with XRE-family HTH domain
MTQRTHQLNAKMVDARRIALGLTLADVAKKTKVSESTLSRWMNGQKVYTKNLKRLSDALDIAIELLIAREGRVEGPFFEVTLKFPSRIGENAKDIVNAIQDALRVAVGREVPVTNFREGSVFVDIKLTLEELVMLTWTRRRLKRSDHPNPLTVLLELEAMRWGQGGSFTIDTFDPENPGSILDSVHGSRARAIPFGDVPVIKPEESSD